MCHYRNCDKKVNPARTGRPRKFCNNACKCMEQYHKNKDKRENNNA